MRAIGLSLDASQRVALFGAARGVLSAAVRLGIIGSYEAQRLQHRARAVAGHRGRGDARALDADDLAQTAPLARPAAGRARPAVLATVSVVGAFDPESEPGAHLRRCRPRDPMHYMPHDDSDATTPRVPASSRAGTPPRPRLPRARVHHRHRRPGGQRQDRAAAGALPPAARRLQPGRGDQRHLHEGGRRVPGAQPGAARRAHHARSRPAAARTRPCATTSARTSTRWSS